MVAPPNKALQLTPNSSVRSDVVAFWRRALSSERWRSALLDAAERPAHQPAQGEAKGRQLLRWRATLSTAEAVFANEFRNPTANRSIARRATIGRDGSRSPAMSWTGDRGAR